MRGKPESPFLTATEVAALFCVDVKTVARWAKNGRLSSIRTPGGHFRFYADEVNGFLHPGQCEQETS